VQRPGESAHNPFTTMMNQNPNDYEEMMSDDVMSMPATPPPPNSPAPLPAAAPLPPAFLPPPVLARALAAASAAQHVLVSAHALANGPLLPLPQPLHRNPSYAKGGALYQRMVSWTHSRSSRFHSLLRIRRVMHRYYEANPHLERPTGRTLDKPGVVYAIYSRFGRMLYVGTTWTQHRNCMHRMKEHITQAVRISNGIIKPKQDDLIHFAMAKHGWENFGITVLEKVPFVGGAGNMQRRCERIEKEWQHRFMSHLPHRGYNVSMGMRFGAYHNRARRVRAPGTNPLMRRRRGLQAGPVAAPHLPMVAPAVHAPAPQAVGAAVPEVAAAHPLPNPPAHAAPQQGARVYGFRDGRRRVRALLTHLRKTGGLKATRARLTLLYRRPALLRMYRTLHDTLALTPLALQADALFGGATAVAEANTRKKLGQMQKLLLAEILKRAHAPGQKKGAKPSRKLMIFPFASDTLDKLRISSILADPAVTALLGELEPLVGVPTVCFAYGDTSARMLVNVKAVLGELSERKVAELRKQRCLCGKPHYKQWVDPHHKHIITSKTSILRGGKLGKLMDRGTKYRQEFLTVDSSISESIRASVDKFAVTQARVLEVNSDKLGPWKAEVCSRIEAALGINAAEPEQVQADPEDVQVGKHSRALKWLHKHFVVTAQDKAEGTYVMVCKKHYCIKVWEEATQSATYEVSARSEEEVAAAHGKWLQEEGLAVEEPSTRHAHLYATVKAHKNPTGLRYIAASRNVTLTPLSERIAQALQVLQPVVDDMWRTLAYNTGKRAERSWIIPNADAVLGTINLIDSMLKLQGPGATMRVEVWDFKTLYTNIPLADLKTRLCQLVDDAFTHYNTTHGNTSHYIRLQQGKQDAEKVGWTTDEVRERVESNGDVWVSRNRLKKWITYLVDNIYVTIGDVFLRQKVGVPMGTNCAPNLANLYLFTYEYEYLAHLLTQPDSMPLIEKLMLAHRYIDDVLLFGIDDVESILYTTGDVRGLYPKDVLVLEQTGGATLSREVLDNKGVAYMDVRIVSDKDGVHTTLYDKRDDIAALADTLRCPHPSSRLAEACKLGVITSQFHRFYTKCMRHADLVKVCAQLLARMINMGYSQKQVFGKAKAFGKVLGRRHSAVAVTQWGTTVAEIIKKVKQLVTAAKQ
jgi:hypothetical protein